MADYEFKLNIEAFNDLRNLPGVTADLLRRGEAVANAAGPGYRAQVSSDKKRARVTVWPDTAAARRDEAIHNNLLRNLDAGR
jgi:hypothetical protein